MAQFATAGSPEPDWEPDYDVAGGEGYVAEVCVKAIDLAGGGFDCPACGLSLDTPLLSFPDLDAMTLTEDEFDASEAITFFQRQPAEEDWCDY